MRKLRLLIAAVLLLCLLPVCSLAKGGSIRPWLLDFGDEKWGPVPASRLETRVLHTNGNIKSEYNQKTGVLYHSYIGSPKDDFISDKTFTRVAIKPPAGAVYRVNFYCDDISLTQSQHKLKYVAKDEMPANNILDDVKNPVPDRMKYIGTGGERPEYDYTLDMFNKCDEKCIPAQRASQGKGNVYLAAWYNASKQLIRVDWVVETSDDFSISYGPLNGHIHPGFPTEDDLPDKIEDPSLIIPKSQNNKKFRLGIYYYPNYRGNTDFAELYLMQEDEDIPVPDYDYEWGKVVLYWPYPEGQSYTSPVHYQLKHYMDNTRTEFKILDVTPTEKGLRFETDSFSPFELTWSEIEPDSVSVPETGDKSNILLWAALACLSIVGVAAVVRRRKEA